MDGGEVVVIIAAIAALIVSTIGAIFAGLVQLRSLPKVHELVNSRAKAQDEKIDRLEALILKKDHDAIDLARESLEKAEHRGGPHVVD